MYLLTRIPAIFRFLWRNSFCTHTFVISLWTLNFNNINSSVKLTVARVEVLTGSFKSNTFDFPTSDVYIT